MASRTTWLLTVLTVLTDEWTQTAKEKEGKGFGRQYLHEVPLLIFIHDQLDRNGVNPTRPAPSPGSSDASDGRCGTDENDAFTRTSTTSTVCYWADYLVGI